MGRPQPKIRSNAIRAWRKRADLSLEELADRIGMSHSNLGRIERGLVPLGEQYIPALAEALAIHAGDIFRDPDLPLQPGVAETAAPFVFRRRHAPLVGYVGAGAEAHLYAEGQGPFDEVEAPEIAGPDTVAVEIRGESLGALFNEWLIFYDDVRSPVTPDLHNRLCVVGLPDGRVLVKQLKRAPDGRFHLISNTEGPLLDQEVVWAAPVKDMRPRG